MSQLRFRVGATLATVVAVAVGLTGCSSKEGGSAGLPLGQTSIQVPTAGSPADIPTMELPTEQITDRPADPGAATATDASDPTLASPTEPTLASPTEVPTPEPTPAEPTEPTLASPTEVPTPEPTPADPTGPTDPTVPAGDPAIAAEVLPADLCTLIPKLDYTQQSEATAERCKLDGVEAGSTGGYVVLSDEGEPVLESNPSRISAEVTTTEIAGRTVYFWNRTDTEINAVFNTGSTSLWLRIVAFQDADFMRGAAEQIVAYAIEQIRGGGSGAGSSAAPQTDTAAPADLCSVFPAPSADMVQQPGDTSYRCNYSGAELSVSLVNAGFPVQEQDPSHQGLPTESATIGGRQVWSWVDTTLSNHTAVVTFNVANTSLSLQVTGGSDDAALLSMAQDLATQVIGNLGG